ncbi:YeeE/YedE family protein [Aquabacterium sp.]|uniref:YeeE/YedE family protein n=1 Tax=Aquabacterium sp. TaxID=1872578 RepID=UPI002C15A398|nr:YeeE/YedE family protein [Aquabacterium sp.]HSW08411.1 YeeE/YedE family protein [Aquabacterium sp.]
MSDAELQALGPQVLWAAFALGGLFGAIAQRTHFCTMGAVADVVNIGDWTRLRMWALAIGVAMLGFNAMVLLGWLRAADSLYAAPQWQWLSQIVGGLMFGFGMVLASGCGSKTLVRVGGGNLKSLVVFCVLAIAAFATLKGITAVARVNTIDRVVWALPAGQDLPSLVAWAFGGSAQHHAGWLGALIGGGVVAWVLVRREGRSAAVLLGGIGIGAVVVGAWWVSGRLGHLAEHPQTLEPAFLATNSQRMEAFSFVAPLAYAVDWLLFFSDKSKLLTQGIVIVAGVVLGSAVAALLGRSFRWEGFRGVEDTANHLVGAVLMGVGGVCALGCTIGQGLSGVSTLSIGSFVALAAIVGGAVLALRWQVWRIERQA